MKLVLLVFGCWIIDDSSNITADQIKAKVNKLKNKEGRIDLIVIDHMQLIADNKVKSQTLSETSAELELIKMGVKFR